MATCDYLLRLILIGDSGVGKSIVLGRFCSKDFNIGLNTSTIGWFKLF